MNAVSPTRSTRTLLALSCWHSAGVAMANMMSRSKYEKSAELDGFKNWPPCGSMRTGQTPQATTNRLAGGWRDGRRERLFDLKVSIIVYYPVRGHASCRLESPACPAPKRRA